MILFFSKAWDSYKVFGMKIGFSTDSSNIRYPIINKSILIHFEESLSKDSATGLVLLTERSILKSL